MRWEETEKHLVVVTILVKINKRVKSWLRDLYCVTDADNCFYIHCVQLGPQSLLFLKLRLRLLRFEQFSGVKL